MNDFTSYKHNPKRKSGISALRLSVTSLLFVLFSSYALHCYAQSNTGWQSPFTNPYNFNNNVTNPTRVYSSDNLRAEFDTDNDIADFGGFNFNIPAGSLILGIEVQIEGYNANFGWGGTPRQLQAVSLSWDNGDSFTAPVSLTTFNTTEQYQSIASSLWDRSWSTSDLSYSNFRIRLDATIAYGDLFIDHVQVRVWYFEMTSPLSISTPGTYTFTVPEGVNCIQVNAWGGGGGGSSRSGDAGGGGGGAFAGSLLAVNPGENYVITIGSGGNPGAAGGNSSFSNLVIAAGGGSGNGESGSIGGSAASSTGETKWSGGNGGSAPNYTSGGGGGGGGSAYPTAIGNPGSNGGNFYGGTGGTGSGNGGRGADRDGTPAAQAGNTPGGGGGGRGGDSGQTSGRGGDGKIEIHWTSLLSASAPTIQSQVCTGATSVTGTSSEPNGTQISLYKNGASIGTTTVTSGSWALSGLSPALTGGDVLSATAKTVGKCISPLSPEVVVQNNTTLTLTSAPGTTNQTLCINTPLITITYSTTGATGANVTGLPDGVTGNWNSNQVTISGTPVASGNYTYTITPTGGCNSPAAIATGTIHITPNNTITLTSSPGTNNQTPCINTPITNITYATTGATGATFNGLPAGVSGSWASNQVTISGTPTVSGNFSYTITITGGCNNPAVTASGSINISPNNTLTLSSDPGTTNQTPCIYTPINPIVYSTTGATGANFSGLPNGVTGSWNSDQITISGTPNVSGNFNYTITLTGGCNNPPVTASGTINVSPNNTISLISASGTNNQTPCINSSIATIVYQTSGATGATFTGLPDGVSGSWTGNQVTISGTPTVWGNFPYTVTTTGGCNNPAATANGTINVLPNNTISLSSASGTNNQNLCINTPITTITYTTTGATGADITGLPAGVTGSWSSNQVTISGTPTVSGNYSYTITTTGGCNNPAATASGTINISPNNTISLSSPSGTNNQTLCINTPITQITYSTTGATGATITGLPTGVSGSWSNNQVTISGTPTNSGNFTYTVTTTGGCNNPMVTASGNITVTPNNTITLTSAPETINQNICINAPISEIVYSTTGATGASFTGLPDGVVGSWNGNQVTISGTPTVSGNFTYTVTTTGGCTTPAVTASGSFHIFPNNTITLTSSTGTDNQTPCINTPIFTITYSTTGATGVSFSSLPDGVTGSWNSNQVTISGTPTVSGAFNYTVTTTGGCNNPAATASGTIDISPNNTITLSSPSGSDNQTACINAPINAIVYTTTGASGANFSGLPAGVSGSWNSNQITISGTPSVSGSYNYTITSTGGCNNPAATASGTIHINPNNTITLTSTTGTDHQTPCINTSINAITYSTTGATGPTFSGLPNGVTGSWNSDQITISGTPIVSGNYTYTITLTGGCNNPAVTASGTINIAPNNTITLNSASGSDNQSICIHTPINTITYTTTGATGATFTGLPSGVSGTWNNNLITIYGTPVEFKAAPFTFTIQLTGGCGSVSASGTITVIENATVNAGSSLSICQGSTSPALGGSIGGSATGASWSSSVGGSFNYPTPGDYANATWTPPASFYGEAVLTLMTKGPCVSVTADKQVTVNRLLPVGVTIAAAPAGPVCAGTSILFTTTVVNGGASPIYQWSINGNPITGANGATFTSNALNDNDVVSCMVTSNEKCTSENPATSNLITMDVNPILPVSISISASPSGAICTGTAVTFTASPVNGGPSPSYQWKINGDKVAGATNATFTSNTLNNNDIVTCEITSSATCTSGNPALSNPLPMQVNAILPVSVTISANPGGAICEGTNVTFTASPVNEGSSPAYQWKLNGNNVGANNATYSNASLKNNDIISCVLTSSETCKTGSPATSNPLTMQVHPILPASVTISASPAGTICNGTEVTFTAVPTNGGASPSYQWYKGSDPISGATGATLVTSDLAHDDVITVRMTSSEPCPAGSPATSNAITMSVSNKLPVSVSIAVSGNSVCSGTSVTFTATPTNGGASPSYQWYKNTAPVGSNSSTYTTNPANGDQIYVVLTSSETCVSGNPATSELLTMVINSLPVVDAGPDLSIPHGTTVTISGATASGSGSLSYSWTPTGAFTNAAVLNPTTTNLTATNQYTLTVTDANGCSNNDVMTINVTGSALAVNPVASPTAVCAGSPSQLTANASGGSGSYTYSWTSNPTGFNSTEANPTVNPSITTVYSLTVDDRSNSATGTVNITVYPIPTVSVDSPEICASVGSAPITATPGSAGSYQYTWSVPAGASNPGNVATFNASVAGDYSVVITDANNCTGTGNGTLSIHPNPTVTVNSPAICAGSGHATITATPSPAGTYTYDWTVPEGASDPGDVSSFTTNVAGIYTVEITDGKTCKTTGSGTLTVHPLPTVTVNSDEICASEGVASISATPSPAGTYTYVWTVPDGLTNPGNVSGFNTAIEGTYSVTITNSDGCTATGSGTLVINPNPTVTVNSPVICAIEGTDTITASPVPASGTYHYTWTFPTGASNPGDMPSFQASVPGTYTVSISDGKSCTASASGTLTINANPTVTVNSPSICPDGSTAEIKATPSPAVGSYTYTWVVPSGAPDPAGAASFNTKVPGNYTVTISDGNNCSASGSGILTLHALPAAPVTGGDKTICANQDIPELSVTVGSGETTDWFDTATGGNLLASGSLSYKPSAAGTYYAQTRNSVTHCVSDSRTAVSLTIHPLPTATIDGTAAICQGGTPEPLLTLTGNGGTAPYDFVYRINSGPFLNASGNNQVSLTAPTSVAGTFQYQLTSVTDHNNCVSSISNQTATITVHSLPQPPFAVDREFCFDGASHSASATPAAGESVVWYDAPVNGNVTSAPTATAVGSYSAYAAARTDATGCESPSRTLVTLTIHPIPSVNNVDNKILCNSEVVPEISLTGSVPGTVFAWTNSNPSIGLPGTGSGTIPSFTATNTGTAPITATIAITPMANTCTGSIVTFTIIVNPTPIANQPASVTVCNDATIPALTLSGNVPGATYSWTNDNTSIGLTANGTNSIPAFKAINMGNTTIQATITITPSFTHGGITCTGEPKNFTITVLPTPTAVVPIEMTFCHGMATSPYSLSGTPSDVLFNITGGTAIGLPDQNGVKEIPSFTPVAGNAVITVTPVSNGCTGTHGMFNMVVRPIPSATITGTTTVCQNAPAPNLVVSNATPYNVKVTYTINGTISASININGNGNATISVPTAQAGSFVYALTEIQYLNEPLCNNNTLTGSATVVVNALPAATLTGPANACAGSGNYVYTTEAGMNGYVWTVSSGGVITSGGTGTDHTATITWNTAGIQTVSVQYSSPQGCAVLSPVSRQVTVSTLPVPTLTGLVNVCNGATGVTYTTQTGMTDYLWTVSPGGNITSGGGTNNNTMTINWHTEGPQTVSVNYTNSNGCTAITPTIVNVTVNTLPLPTLSGPAEVCASTSGHIYTTEAGMTNYSWSVSAGGSITAGNSSSSNAITVRWNTPGAQKVSVNYANISGCTAAAVTQYDVTVNALPVPTISGDGLACGGSSVTYTTEPGMTQYQWTVSSGGTVVSGGTQTDPTITVLWSGSGAQSVRVAYTNPNGCTASTPTVKNITVSTEVTATLTGVTEVCQGSTNRVYTTQSGMSNYTWNIPAGATVTSGGTPSSNTVNITWTGAGPQIIGVSYTSSNGCRSTTATLTINVNPLPIPVITGDNEVCAGDEGIVYTTESGMSNYIWTISPGGTITSGGGTTHNTVTVTWNTTGSQQVSVRYTSPFSCSAAASTVFPVNVNPLPVVNCPDDIRVCISAASFALGGGTPSPGQYSGPGVSSGSMFNPNTAGLGTHTIVYSYTNSNGCLDTCHFRVIVEPIPFAPNQNFTFCSGELTHIDLDALIPGATFTWQASLLSGANITGFSACTSSCGSIIEQILINPTFTTPPSGAGTNGIVRYIVTPTLNECTGTPFNIDVTVLPAPPAFNITWHSQNDLDIFEICSGDVVMSENDLDILMPNGDPPANRLFLNYNVQWQYSVHPDGPWLQAPGDWVGGANYNYTGNYQWLVATELNNQIGDYYFRFVVTNSNGCSSSSDIAEMHIISTITVEAGGPDYVCASSSPDEITLSGAYVGGISTTTKTGRWTASAGTITYQDINDPSTARFRPPSNWSGGDITLTLTTNDPDGNGPCDPLTDERIIRVLSPDAYATCLSQGNWEFANTNSDGSATVDCGIEITGGNNGSNNPGNTSITHCSGSGTLSFDWSFTAPANKIVWHSEDQQVGGYISGTELRVNRPTNVSAGDLIIVTVHVDDNLTNVTSSNGFTPIGVTRNNSYDATVASFYKIAGNNEPVNYTFTVTGGGVGSNDRIFSTRVTGHSTTTPIGNFNQNIGNVYEVPNTNNWILPIDGINNAFPNSLLVAAVTVNASPEYPNSPVGMLPVYYNNYDAAARVAIETLSSTGPTGTRTFFWPRRGTNNSYVFQVATHMFIINPMSNPDIDAAYFLVNGTPALLTDIGDTEGHVSIPVNSKDNIGFMVTTQRNTGGPGILNIYNLTVPNDIPVATGLSAITIPDCQDPAYTPVFQPPTALDDCGTLTTQTTDSGVTEDDCSRSQSRTWVFVDNCGTASTPFVQTATWTVALPFSVTCPADPHLPPCSNSTAIETAYNAWKAGFTHTGGCNVTTNINEIPPLTDLSCGGQLVFDFIATDLCGRTRTCSSTFTVDPPSDLTLTYPTHPLLPACSTQAEIESAYNTWKNGFSFSGGCTGVTSNIASIPVLPTNTGCGFILEFDFTAEYRTPNCVFSVNHLDTFTVEAPVELKVTVPNDVSLSSCSTTNDIQTAYDNWKSGFFATGGCSPITNIATIPTLGSIACGGTISFTYSADNPAGTCTSHAEATSTFTVGQASPISVSCPADPNLAACTDETTIANAYNTWVNGFKASGGCQVTTNIANIPPLGDIVCGGQLSFTFRAENGPDRCADHAECTATFTVGTPPTLTVNAPASESVTGCANDPLVITAFNTWLNQFSHSGGCQTTATDLSGYKLPDLCSGTIHVTYTVSDRCGQSASATSTFTVTPAALTVICPGNYTVDGCKTQTEIDAEFSAWLAGFSHTDGCNVTATNLSGLTPPDALGDTIYVEYNISDACGQVNHCAASFITPYCALHFRTVSSGNWKTHSIWETSPDESTWNTTTKTPDYYNSKSIRVMDGHVVTVSDYIPVDRTFINPGGAVTVNVAGGALRNVVETADGHTEFIIESSPDPTSGGNGSGSLIALGDFLGKLTYNRQMRPDDYHYFSSPVGGLKISDFFALNSGKVDGIWSWSEPAQDWNDLTSSSDPFQSGKGYNLGYQGGDGKYAFPGSVVRSASVLVSSPFITGATAGIDRPEYDNLELVSGRDYGAGGWNLLGNPFTSAMNANAFISANAASFDPNYQAIYLYAGDEGTEGIYYWIGVDGGDWTDSQNSSTNIQAGQGFFVLARNNAVSFTFDNSMQLHDTDVKLKSTRQPSWPGLRLTAQSGGQSMSTLVIFNDDMSTGLDPGYDIGLLSSGRNVEIYTALVKDNGFEFARQALPVNGYEKNIIPVGVDAPNGGTVTFSAYMVPINNGTFWLEDRTAGSITDLSRENYTVALPKNTLGTGRFFIHASPLTSTERVILRNDLTIRIWTSNQKVFIEGEVSGKAKASVYDMLGRKIHETRLEDVRYNTFELPSVVKGVYMVRVDDGGRSSTRKVVF